MDIGKTKIPPGMSERELLMIKAQQPKNSRVQIVNVNLVLGCLEAKLIRRTMDVTSVNSASGQPHAEPIMVVVPPINFSGVRPRFRQFDGRRAAKFPTPNHQR